MSLNDDFEQKLQSAAFAREMKRARTNGERRLIEVRCMQELVRAELMKLYQNRHRTSEAPGLDPQLLTVLIDGFNDLLLGRTPNIFRKQPIAKGSAKSVAVEAAKLKALMYIECAKRRRLKDRHPVKTIARLYDVDSRLIRYWRKQLGDEALRKSKLLSRYQLAYLGAFIDRSADSYIASRKVTKTRYLQGRSGNTRPFSSSLEIEVG